MVKTSLPRKLSTSLTRGSKAPRERRIIKIYPNGPPGWRFHIEDDPAPRTGAGKTEGTGEVTSVLAEYVGNTTLHGVKYLQRTAGCSRCYWAITMLGMVVAASYFIFRVVSTYYYTPTLLSIENTDFPIHRIRFPALTVCNMNKIDSRRMPPDQRLVLGSVMFDNTSEWHERVEHVLENVYATDNCFGEHCEELHSEDHFTTEQVFRIIELTSPSCDEMISSCSWRNSPQDCSELFEPHHTDFGYCCIFNSDFEHARDEGADDQRYTDAGYTNGLSMMLDARRYEYSHSQYLSVGFKVLIHAPYDEPEVRERGLAIQPGREMFISITAEQVYTTEEALYSFTPKQRNCFEEHEVELEFADTHVYTLPNCLLSHLTARVYSICGCVAHYMPGNGTICGEDDLPCLRRVIYNGSKDLTASAEAWKQCLPACSEIKYLPYTSSSEFPSYELIAHPTFGETVRLIIVSMCKELHHHQVTQEDMALAKLCQAVTSGPTSEFSGREVLAALLAGTGGHDDSPQNSSDSDALYAAAVRYGRDNMVKVHAYFKGNSITRYKRDVLYTKEQLVANIGGLLGLFLGFSIVSIAEILYFLAIRLLPQPAEQQTKIRPSSDTQDDTITASFIVTSAGRWRPRRTIP